MHRAEDPVLSERGGHAVPREVALEAGTDARESETYVLLLQVLYQFAQGSGFARRSSRCR